MYYASQSAERYWRARAARLARRVNLGWWWQQLGPALVGVNLAGAGALVLCRQLQWPLAYWAAGFGLAVLAAALWAWRRARGQFFSAEQGLLRLETHLGWHNALSAAAAGGAAWPKPPDETVRPLRWNWGRLSGPVAVSAALLILGLLLPVAGPGKTLLPDPSEPPAALVEVEAWTLALQAQDVIEPAMLEAWNERVEQLRSKPASEWYRQDALEAAEHLRNQMMQEIDTLGKNLAKAASLLPDHAAADALPTATSLAQTPGGELGQNQPPSAAPSAALAQASSPTAKPETMAESLARAEADRAMQQLLANLQNSPLPLNPELARALSNPRQATPREISQLREKLQQASSTCESCCNGGNCPGGQPGSNPGAASTFAANAGQSPASAPAAAAAPQTALSEKAGISRGPGTAPMALSNSGTDVRAGKMEGVSNAANGDAELGERWMTAGGAAPQPEKAELLPVSAGAAAAGSGGDAVWRMELSPQERAVLQKYFK